MDNPFKVADIHAWLKQVTEGQISYSRMVELMNEQSEAYHAAKSEQKQHLVELMKMDEGKDGHQCFTKEMIEDRFGFPATEKEVQWFNAKASNYATDRAKKALEKVLSMLRENQAASSQLVPEDAARSAQDIINETFVDLIEIVQTFKP